MTVKELYDWVIKCSSLAVYRINLFNDYIDIKINPRDFTEVFYVRWKIQDDTIKETFVCGKRKINQTRFIDINKRSQRAVELMNEIAYLKKLNSLKYFKKKKLYT